MNWLLQFKIICKPRSLLEDVSFRLKKGKIFALSYIMWVKMSRSLTPLQYKSIKQLKGLKNACDLTSKESQR